MFKNNMFASMKKSFLNNPVFIQLKAKTKEVYENLVKKDKIPTRQKILDNPIQSLSVSVFVAYTSIAYLYLGHVNTRNYSPVSWKRNSRLAIEKNSNSPDREYVRKDDKAKEHKKDAKILGEPQSGEDHFRIILLGATGSGKSSAGNVLLGKEIFKTSYYATSETKKSKLESVTTDSCKVDIIDTPAVCDTGENDEDIKKQMEEAVRLSSKGPHAFLLCIPATSITKYFIECFEPFKEYYHDNIDEFVIVAFTRYDEFEMQCSNGKNPENEFDKKLADAIAQNCNLDQLKNIKKNQIFLRHTSKVEQSAALAQVIKHIRETMTERKIKEKTQFARSKIFEKNA